MVKNTFSKIRKKLEISMQEKREKKVKLFSESLRNQSPVIVFGNQKTGSTAIAALLAKAISKPVTLDIKEAISDVSWQLCVKYNLLSFKEVVYKYRKDFSRPIVKEPNLSYFYDEIIDILPNAKFVFIQRNPYQNIRSVLNRLKIPGHLNDINYDDWPELCHTPVWRLTLDSSWLGRPQGSYIEGMAHRWDIAAKVYFKSPERFILIKYEDFLRNKKASIEGLAGKLGLSIKEDIGSLVDVQYQRKGNPEISPNKFFGDKNQELIRKICGESARRLGYKL